MASSDSAHVVPDLPAYVVGRLAESSAAPIRAHLAGCFDCSVRATYLRVRLDRLRAELAPVASFEEMHEISPHELEAKGSFARVAGHVAKHLSIPEDDARKILRSLASGRAKWGQGPRAGISILPLACGERGVKGFAIRIEPGVTYPMHRHDGEERLFILQGGLVDHDGAQVWRGDKAVFASETCHASTALPVGDCILIAASRGSTVM